MTDNSPDINLAPATPLTDKESLPGANWQQQDGVLRDLWMQNKTPQEIGEILGRSVPAIMTRAARLGLPRRSAPGRKPGSGATRLPSQRQTGDGIEIQETRRAAQPPRENRDQPKETAPQAMVRVCLMCLRKFESAGRHNRICAPCKGSSEYIQASTIANIHLPNA